MSKRPLAALVALVVLASPIAALPQEPTALERIRAQVQEANQKVGDISKEIKNLETAVRTSEAKLADSRKRAGNLTAELAQVDIERQKIVLEMEDLERQGVELRARSIERLRALYLQRQQGLAESVLLISGGSNIGRNALYLRHVRDHDLNVLRRVAELRNQKDRKRLELEAVVKDRDLLRSKLMAEQVVIRDTIEGQKASKIELGSKRTKLQAELTGLRAQALRLETVMSSITAPSAAKLDVTPSVTAQAKAPTQAFDGPGLEALKGKLSSPVQGSVLKSKADDQSFSDMVFSKGIQFRAEDGVVVRSVAAGRVMFVGAMPAYGTVVIMDHGQRSYSLYGLLGSISVKVSDSLAQGDSLGSVGKPDGEARNFYFEVRKNGIAFDPKKLYPQGFGG